MALGTSRTVYSVPPSSIGAILKIDGMQNDILARMFEVDIRSNYLVGINRANIVFDYVIDSIAEEYKELFVFPSYRRGKKNVSIIPIIG